MINAECGRNLLFYYSVRVKHQNAKAFGLLLVSTSSHLLKHCTWLSETASKVRQRDAQSTRGQQLAEAHEAGMLP
jgi:hypothetical protein